MEEISIHEVFDSSKATSISAREKSITTPVRVQDMELDTIEFIHCFFKEAVQFENCTFKHRVNFEGSRFSNGISLLNCRFEEFLLMRGAALGQRASFTGSKFLKGLSLAAGDGVLKDGSLGENVRLYHLNFSRCEFHGYITFNNREILRSANFDFATFHSPPHFQNCELHQGTTFSETKFDIVDEGDERSLHRAEIAYRRLKTLMKERGAHAEYNLFYAAELKLRGMQHISRIERAIIGIYAIGSDYGRSLARPISVLLIVTAFNLTAITVTVSGLAKGKSCLSIVRSSASFLAQQMFRPFSVWDTDYVAPGILNSVSGTAKAVLPVCGTLETLAAFTSIGLLVFAIKRRFPS